MALPGRNAENPDPSAGGQIETDTYDLEGLVQTVLAGITVVAAVVVFVAHRDNPMVALLLAAMVGVSGWLSIIDLAERRLPNRIVYPLAVVVTAGLLLAGLWTQDFSRSGRAMLIGLAASLLFLLGNLLGGIGMGDVKYAYPLWATLGWFGTPPVTNAVFVTILVGGITSVVILAMGKGRKYRLPFGPFMSIGFVAGLLAAAPGL